VGGGAAAALDRIGRLADGYHSTAIGPDVYARRAGTIKAAAVAAGRPEPTWSARVRVELEGGTASKRYAMRGDPDAMTAEIEHWASVGVEHLALYFDETDPERLVRAVESFASGTAR
jgi:alkanesulfonate monooxygenase SsuD/methylene tetrahydromethanopterin reductase-like flavin-dependent oxidoreductase (luciferase family)